MDVREERPGEETEIGALITEAFLTAAHSSGTEAQIVAGLRAAGALTHNLVAVEGRAIVGHIACSEVLIDGKSCGWFALGPVSVIPERQGEGIGGELVRAALARLEAQGAAGCVLVGDPGYYGRFGFAADPALCVDKVPGEYVLALSLAGPRVPGVISHHRAFGLEG
ncbi:MAG: putative aetyltransferase YhbS [Rhodobacteraceae bacterium HLUCCA12]|nr:MAG: putative aetyltransferase YhbS [Rhodobacteraceae bacterium HLUCCA12]